ncbi:MAG: ROK family protein [Brevibacillus sp.]|nr:ROK family protein [Brevibacillus sp.]
MNVDLTRTWNQHVVKKGNKSIVLEIIKNRSPISRADIASLTNLNKGTVSSLVNELIDEHLIYETGPGESTGGRRPIMLIFNASAGYSIGIDIGVNYILGILTDLKGEILLEQIISMKRLDYAEILNKVIDMITYFKSNMKKSPYGLIGIGIGVPGIVQKNGTVLLAPNLGWKNIPLKQIIEDKFHVPVIIENEANGGAYGEKVFGIGQKSDNMVYVSAGIGIGVGLIIDGRLYQGNMGYAGEMGHMTVNVNGGKCRCGNSGCWELYASEQALIQKAIQNGYDENDISLEKLMELANTGDKKAIQIFAEVGEMFGIGITNIINTFNPQQIVIGNRMASAEKWLREAVERKLKENLLWFFKDNLTLDFSQLAKYSTSLGMTAFSIENFLKIDLTSESS